LPSSWGGVVEKKKVATVAFSCGGVAKKKKMTTTFVTFFDNFVAKNGNGNYRHLFDGFATKKVTIAMSSLSSKMVVL